MAWNGSGTFSRTNGDHTGSTLWTTDKNQGFKITSVRHDTHDQDLADGINNSLAKDGQNAMTGNLDMGSNDITNVGNITGNIRAEQLTFTGARQVIGVPTFDNGLISEDSVQVNAGITTTAPLTCAGITFTGGTAVTGNPDFADTVDFNGIVNMNSTLVIDSSPPTAASDPGTAGTVTYDSNYIYICVAEDTWRRAAIAAW